MSIKEVNIALIRRFYRSICEVSYLQQINEVDNRETGIINFIRNTFAEVYTSDCLIHDIKGDRSFEEVIKETASYFVAFPDTKIIVEDMIADGDKVVTRWTMRSTHEDTFRQSISNIDDEVRGIQQKIATLKESLQQIDKIDEEK